MARKKVGAIDKNLINATKGPKHRQNNLLVKNWQCTSTYTK